MSGNPPSFGSFKYDVIVEKDVIINSRNGITERWEVQNSLGSGTFGAVSRHSLVDSGRRSYRAVKEIYLRPGVTVNSKMIATELKAMVAFREDTDLFVTLFGWYEGNNSICIAMEYLGEGDLRVYMGRDPDCAKKHCSAIITQILKALEVMHSRYFCHRDLKPENILIASRCPPKVKLADFGVSKSTDPSASIMQTETGTPKYMSPEVQGYNEDTSEYTNAVDIWAMGAITHEIFTGIAPFCICPHNRTTTCTTIHPNREIHLKAEPSRSMLSKFCYNQTSFPDVHLTSSLAPWDLIDFIKKAMQFLPDARPSASKALEHSWINPREPMRNGVVTEQGCVAAIGPSPTLNYAKSLLRVEPGESVARVASRVKRRVKPVKRRVEPVERQVESVEELVEPAEMRVEWVDRQIREMQEQLSTIEREVRWTHGRTGAALEASRAGREAD